MNKHEILLALSNEVDILFVSILFIAIVALIIAMVQTFRLHYFRVHLEHRNQLLKDKFGTTEDFY